MHRFSPGLQRGHRPVVINVFMEMQASVIPFDQTPLCVLNVKIHSVCVGKIVVSLSTEISSSLG